MGKPWRGIQPLPPCLSSSSRHRAKSHNPGIRGWRSAVQIVRQRRTVKRYTVAVLLVGALACTDSNAPPVHKPGSFGILPERDTVAAGVSVTFVAEREDSSIDAWQVSDTGAARIDAHERGWARVMTLAAGTVSIKAKSRGDSGQATLVILPPPPPPPAYPFTVSPMLDTVKVGDLVTFYAEDHEPVATWTPYQWSVSDSGLGQLGVIMAYAARVAARAPGTLTIAAFHHGDTVRATLVILPPPPPPPDTTALPGGWDVINLGVLNAVFGRPAAINDSGTIVGVLYSNPDAVSGYEQRAFIYSHGMMRQLSGLDTLPQTIGPSGVMGGVTKLANGQGQFLVWDSPDAAPRALPNGTFGWGWGGRIIGVNARGDILASIGEDGPESSTALYRTGRLWRNDSPVDLGQLNPSVAMRTLPTAWNTRGQIVGWSPVAIIHRLGDDGYPSHPFLWENGVMRDLGILGSSPCGEPVNCGGGVATAINVHGTVVGQSTTDSSRLRAFIWENGEMRDLGPFPGQSTNALAINDRGQVLGAVGATTFLWENGKTQILPFDGSLFDLNGSFLGNASFLGPNGEVVGTRGGHVIFWQAGQETDLGEGWPIAMNNRGEIIGTRGALPTLWRKRGS